MATYLFDGTNSTVDVDEYISNLATGNVDPVLYGFDENKNKIELTDLLGGLYDLSYTTWNYYSVGSYSTDNLTYTQAQDIFNDCPSLQNTKRRCRLEVDGSVSEIVKYIETAATSIEVTPTGSTQSSTVSGLGVAFYDKNLELLRLSDITSLYYITVGFSYGSSAMIEACYDAGTTLFSSPSTTCHLFIRVAFNMYYV